MEYEILLKEKEYVEEKEKSRRKKTKKDVKLRKYMKAPVKMLVKARELYVTSMNRLSDVPFGHDLSALPRSFSANHARSINVDKTMSELIRVASVRNMIIVETNPEGHEVREPSMMRNFSVGMAKIDEDKPYQFSSRSKSYSVSKSSYTYASQLN